MTVYAQWITVSPCIVIGGGLRSGVEVSALASINEVNKHQARFVLRWVDRIRVQFPMRNIYLNM